MGYNSIVGLILPWLIAIILVKIYKRSILKRGPNKTTNNFIMSVVAGLVSGMVVLLADKATEITGGDILGMVLLGILVIIPMALIATLFLAIIFTHQNRE